MRSDGAHGWNIDIAARKRKLLLVRPPGLERSSGCALAFCTLLGPEGPGRDSSGGRATNLWTSPRSAWCRRGGYRPYFENYTVDASILETGPRSCLT